MGEGTSLLKFEDGEEVGLNDGLDSSRPVLPQFAAVYKTNDAAINRLKTQLPDIKAQLLAEAQRVAPETYVHTSDTKDARTGFIALLDSVILEPTTD